MQTIKNHRAVTLPMNRVPKSEIMDQVDRMPIGKKNKITAADFIKRKEKDNETAGGPSIE